MRTTYDVRNLIDGNPVRIHSDSFCSRGFFQELAADPDALLVTTAGMVRRGDVEAVLGQAPRCRIRTIGSNPDLDAIDALRAEAASLHVRRVVGFGAGSAMDTAKLAAFLLAEANAGLTLDGLLRQGKPFVPARLPLVLVPTTSGTGSEMTPYACVWDRSGEGKYKYTFSDPTIHADEAYLDPEPASRVPTPITVNAALDTCSHAIETLWNRNATPESVAFANQALSIWADALPRTIADPADHRNREDMEWACVAAARAITISKTSIAHSISYPVTFHYGVPHGLACSFALKRLADRVSAKDAWMPGTDRTRLERVFEVYATLRVDDALGRYCGWDQVRNLTAEMFTPGRSDSFVLPESDVLEVFSEA